MIKTAFSPTIKINLTKFKGLLHIFKKIDKANIISFAMTISLSSSKVLGGLTPFGTGFFASVCNAKNLIPNLIGLGAGSLIAHKSLIAMCYVITAAVISAFNILWDKPIKSYVKGTIAGCTLLFTKIVACSVGGLLIYDVIISIAEAIICALTAVAADKAMPIILSDKKRTCLSLGEIVSVASILSAVLLSFNLLPPVMDIKIGNVLGISAIMLINLNSQVPTGAIVGIVVGTVSSMDSYNSGSIIGAYAFSSLISALFRKYGKSGVILSFIMANAIITVFLNGSTEVLINIYEILWASIIVFALPKSIMDKIQYFAHISTSTGNLENVKIRSIYQQQIGKIAESVNILSQNIPLADKDEVAKKEISALVNRTAQKICADCSLRFCCWQKKGSETKKSLLSLLSSAQSHGKAYINDLDDQLKNRCIRTEALLSSFNDSYEFYRTNIMWHKRLNDSKSLSRVQMGSIAKILDNLATEKQSVADTDTIAQIKTALDSEGIIPSGITAYFKESGNLIIELKFSSDKYREDIKFAVAPCLTNALGIKIRFNEIYREVNDVILSYSMCERFCIASGSASVQKHGESVCGDSFMATSLPNGTFIASVSDGMGSGEKAMRESRNTIELLKNFLRCGFSPAHAIRLVNSSLMLSSTDEIFSTVDLCSVNLHTGIADFIKIGGASTYIKTGSSVEKLSSASLPAGILEEIKPKHFSKKMENDSLIILVSDGIENASADDRWLEKRLSAMDTVNPHIIADKILELSMYQSGGKPKDDMTVIAIRVWENQDV